MVRALFTVLLLAASSALASAAPAVASFESAVTQAHASIAALRGAQAKARLDSIGPKIDNLTWELQRHEREVARLRQNLSSLTWRARNYRRGRDLGLSGDLRHFNSDLARLLRDSQWRLNDLRFLAAQAGKDPNLVSSALALTSATRYLQDEVRWFKFDANFSYNDIMNAGFGLEAMDLERDSTSLESCMRDMQSEADALLAKVRGY